MSKREVNEAILDRLDAIVGLLEALVFEDEPEDEPEYSPEEWQANYAACAR